MSKYLRIEPPPVPADDEAQVTQGTRVFYGDEPVLGVVGIKLSFDVDDIVRAELTILCQAGKRDDVIDVTNLESLSREFIKKPQEC